MLRWLIPLFLFTSLTASAQETKLGGDFRGEGTRFKKKCAKLEFKKIPSCLQVLATDHPLHLAIGSIAPQNGVAAGVAFVHDENVSERWSLNYNADGVASMNGSWRAGLYIKAKPRRTKPVGISTSPTGNEPSGEALIPEINLYSEAISLNKLFYFGLGPFSLKTDQAFYGMTETVSGINAIVPIFNRLGVSLFGEFNGRTVSLRGRHGDTSPSIEQLYTEATAPGLTDQPGFVQWGEGIRLNHNVTRYVHLSYAVTLQHFLAIGNSANSFRRLTVDLSHEIPLYKNQKSNALSSKRQIGPDGTSNDESAQKLSFIKNREGTLGFRFLLTESIAPSGHSVPFFFQPTLGGSDINGTSMLGSYTDYRFRAPDVMLLRGTFEHSLPFVPGPFGFVFMADMGQLALTRGDIGFHRTRHTWATGLTIRAGGLPEFYLLYAWGGSEGSHTTAYLSPALFGNAARPSLY